MNGNEPATKADVAAVKADVTAVKGDLAAVKADVTVVKGDLAAVKADVTVVKEDLAAVKKDVAGVKEDLGHLKQDVGVVQQDVGDLKLNVGQLRQNIDQLRGETTHQYHDVVERIDDLKTEMLSAFYSFAKGEQKRMAHIEGDNAALNSRLATIEDRLLVVEHKLNLPPAA